jgi:hypothetical protein
LDPDPLGSTLICLSWIRNYIRNAQTSVPDPDSPDPHVLRPPGSGSRSLVRGVDPDPDPYIILLSSSKNSKKSIDSYCFVTTFGLFIFENDVNVTSNTKKQENFLKKLVFCWHLEGQ